jgi:hypothetical protein
VGVALICCIKLERKRKEEEISNKIRRKTRRQKCQKNEKRKNITQKTNL